MIGFTASANDNTVKWITVGHEPNIKINGLAWIDENNGLYYRLPVREKKNITDLAWLTSKCPSGARVRFKTDSTKGVLESQGNQAATQGLLAGAMGVVKAGTTAGNYVKAKKKIG